MFANAKHSCFCHFLKFDFSGFKSTRVRFCSPPAFGGGVWLWLVLSLNSYFEFIVCRSISFPHHHLRPHFSFDFAEVLLLGAALLSSLSPLLSLLLLLLQLYFKPP